MEGKSPRWALPGMMFLVFSAAISALRPDVTSAASRFPSISLAPDWVLHTTLSFRNERGFSAFPTQVGGEAYRRIVCWIDLRRDKELVENSADHRVVEGTVRLVGLCAREVSGKGYYRSLEEK